jgi:hypothetical protein
MVYGVLHLKIQVEPEVSRVYIVMMYTLLHSTSRYTNGTESHLKIVTHTHKIVTSRYRWNLKSIVVQYSMTTIVVQYLKIQVEPKVPLLVQVELGEEMLPDPKVPMDCAINR